MVKAELFYLFFIFLNVFVCVCVSFFFFFFVRVMYVVVPFFTHCYFFVDFFPLLLSLFVVFHGIRRICVARLSDGWVRLFSLLFFSSVLEVKKEKKNTLCVYVKMKVNAIGEGGAARRDERTRRHFIKK